MTIKTVVYVVVFIVNFVTIIYKSLPKRTHGQVTIAPAFQFLLLLTGKVVFKQALQNICDVIPQTRVYINFELKLLYCKLSLKNTE